jgi:hypothetical protein
MVSRRYNSGHVLCDTQLLLLLWCSIGVRLEYLPPYSPDLNPIEEAFSKIKAFICRNCDIFLASTRAGIMFDLLEAMNIITADDAEGYFRHAGY